MSSWFYVLPAALYGKALADFQTWHLLPLFAVLQTVFDMAVYGAMGGLLVLIVFLFSKAWKAGVSATTINAFNLE